MTTTDRNDPGLKVTRPDGQQENYLVLSEEERRLGFVRPVRRSYIHTGRKVCGKPMSLAKGDASPLPEGMVAWICKEEAGHEWACHIWRPVTARELTRLQATGFLGGCDSVTTMGQALAETYARDVNFYGSTFCCHCGEHFLVGKYGEFVWVDNPNEKVGT